MRSLLFVPGDSERKFTKAMASGADALILDLEDSVAPSGKEEARQTVRRAIEAVRKEKRRPLIYVRVNPLDSGLIDADLDTVIPAQPDGVMLPKARGGQDIMHLSTKLAVREAENDLPDGAILILPIATESAAALFTMGSYAGSSGRLSGLSWGAEDLSADVGALTNRLTDGTYTDPYRLARALALFAASAAEIAPIDTVFTNFRDKAALEAECRAARRDGFTGKLAIHPDQVGAINTAFTPSKEAIARARAIVDAFAANPDLGVIGVDGEMIDRPHIKRAERLLAAAKAARVI
ncbi:citrate lyase subunit beta / citryl-CoA lyase [Rhizobiales bacterium GAS191]|nr:citrate lyase subunit beta / citryl-CoA lyase [Rhizobiales bacterium GAS191]